MLPWDRLGRTRRAILLVCDCWFAGGPWNEPLLPFAVLCPHPLRARPVLDGGDGANQSPSSSTPRRLKPRASKTQEASRPRRRKRARIAAPRLKNVGTQSMPTPAQIEAVEGRMRRRKEAAPALTGDLALVKEAIDLARKAKTDEATATRNRITDPAAQKLVEWFILRHSETTANFSRYAAFIAANPEWPSAALLRRRAEARLWQERSDAATVRGFTGDAADQRQGQTGARARAACGGRPRRLRAGWCATRGDRTNCRSASRPRRYEMFRDLLTREDHRARMDKRIGAKDLRGRQARRATSRRRRACDRKSLCRGQGQSQQGAGCARCGRDRGAAGSRLHAVPDPVDARPEQDRRRGPPGAGGLAGDDGAAGHRSMVARAALARPQAARPGQVPDGLSGDPPCRSARQ